MGGASGMHRQIVDIFTVLIRSIPRKKPHGLPRCKW